MTSPRDDNPLFDLWSEARQNIREGEEGEARRKKGETRRPPPSVRELYTLEENWIPGRGIALIHEDSHSLIGNYRELTHRTEKGARKLIRVDEPISIQATEIIRGWEHLGEARERLIEAQTWETEREVGMEDLVLSVLGVAAHQVELKVCLRFGGIARVELQDHTTFSSLDGQTILTVPRGTNLLEVMGVEAKLELRKELGK